MITQSQYPRMPRRQKVDDFLSTDKRLPPTAAVSRFITFYVNHRDLKLAACQAGLDPAMGTKLYRVPEVQKKIAHKIMLIDVEMAKLKAKANLLTVDQMDAALYEEIHSKKNGHVRVRAIELGYRRTGLIRDGEFYVAPDPSSNRNAPSIYRAQQTTMRRTVTEEVTQIAAQISAPVPDPIFAVREY